MDLDQIQRTMFDATRQPLTADEGMRQRTRDGRSMRGIAEAIIKPNDRLTSFERLEIYNRQYWFRVLSALAEDFEGLRLILGDRAFEKLSVAYLLDCPSQIVHAAQSGLATGRVAARASVSTSPESRTLRSIWCDWNGRTSKHSTKREQPRLT